MEMSASGSMSIRMSVSLSGRLSPRARAEQRGVRHAARPKRGLVLAQSVEDGLSIHGRILARNPPEFDRRFSPVSVADDMSGLGSTRSVR